MPRPAIILLLALLTACQQNTPPQAKKPAAASPPSLKKPAPAPESSPPPAAEIKKSAPRVEPGIISQVDLARLFELRQAGRVLLLDTRPSLFHQLAHIPGSLSLPRKKFAQRYPELKTRLNQAVADGHAIVLYCTDSACPDALATARQLSA
ncbi:MAG: rhodanese-like domain-containing protein, partial [Verrucomicrobiales bacterium]